MPPNRIEGRFEPNLTMFEHVCSRPDDQLDLTEAAMLVAETEYASVDTRRYLAELTELGRRARASFTGRAKSGAERLDRVLRFLFDEVGFHGNSAEYYDPRNSFINDVIDRKTGIPISLAIVLVEVCAKAGIEAQGVSFPGHFLVRSSVEDGALIVDPFAGRLLGVSELRAMYVRAVGQDKDVPTRAIEAAPKRQILLRLLNNLRGIYASRSDEPHLRGVLERMQIVSPSDEIGKELEGLGGKRTRKSPPGRTLN